jgi:DNA topoisomerase-1
MGIPTFVSPSRPPILHSLLADAQRCAELAGLTYVERTESGFKRLRCGKGFRYLDDAGRPVDAETRKKIAGLVIPPAWRDVWICTDDSGHLLATGVDDRGRTQYLYHERWREVRDLINFYRLTEVGRVLPAIRADVEGQLRRRLLDRPRTIATMLRIVDRLGIRIGNDVYAEENDSVGVCTLQKRHVSLRRGGIDLKFRAKSGRETELHLDDPAVTRSVRQLLDQPGRRLFSVDRSPVTADEVNERLGDITGGVVTAKDFRTWRGTLVVFTMLRRSKGDDRERHVLEAIDAASDVLGNTRTVARAHYVHPHVVETYLDGSFAERLADAPRPRIKGMSADERALLGYLDGLLSSKQWGV